MVDDFVLVKQVLAGHKEAFRFLVLRYQRPLFKFLTGFQLNAERVDEVAQETFLRAYKNLLSYDASQGASFSTWLFTIAKNLALNEKSRASAKLEIAAAEMETPARVLSAVAADNPEDAVMAKQRSASLGAALGRLPSEYRGAVVLSYLKEFSLEEVAQIEKCSVGTVKSRIFRGKQILRTLLVER